MQRDRKNVRNNEMFEIAVFELSSIRNSGRLLYIMQCNGTERNQFCYINIHTLLCSVIYMQGIPSVPNQDPRR